MPTGKKEQLAWAVKSLEVDRVRDLLSEWPHGAALIDSEDNTLFHIVASEPQRCAAQPGAAREVLRLLLERGWDVVDQKNQKGERAEIVAARMDPKGYVRQLLMARSQDFRETIRSEAPLSLVKDDSPVPWKWEYLLQDEQRRSFAGVLMGAIDKDKCSTWMATAAEEAPWQNLPGIPRKVAWFVDEDHADTPYRYSGLEYAATVFPPWMRDLRKEVCELCGIPEEQYPNSCNVNIYNDHRGEVGWHSDDEVLFQGLSGDTRIISFSLGSARDFCWRMQGTSDVLGSIPLGDGDIMTMEGLFQKHFKHSVPACEEPCGPRINFTFRWIVTKAHAADACTKGVAA